MLSFSAEILLLSLYYPIESLKELLELIYELLAHVPYCSLPFLYLADSRDMRIAIL